MTARFAHHILILRHAHSSWARPGERDHQRPLDDRGAADAERLAQIFADEALPVDAVACSTAKRAVDTLAPLLPTLSQRVPVAYADELYALGTEAYFAAAKDAGDVGNLLIVGHNPMVEDFTRSLCDSGEEDAIAAIAGGFPTAALAIVGLDRPLAEIAAKSGRLLRIVRP
ncbi:SixA phosphatase family protein [Jiella avicenniae]|uniref:Histidine phosphatase family protein n=1 Tax=Jiella avicenniae TaxID=2907202 RepID=A0A9X1TDY2_9HYPH|nr:histidine phosphatase family protein [Jiella avicenniae]MCE7030673.1 histidine phosphatase family protein [Jiella avicenniae]